ncbi:hypothetical protein Poly21_21620 [Allorhodopirellula heiligendammensis]|uniref:Uncharacterized protein n=1 Tax=Allorhodopirellula heiligendammensis TaxID=2714739 RepID=A0A5C6C5W6_9BACT|nr:hypothetical protein Poly21_21620 [Allorhodopirellula heiligendammensis]
MQAENRTISRTPRPIETWLRWLANIRVPLAVCLGDATTMVPSLRVSLRNSATKCRGDETAYMALLLTMQSNCLSANGSL